VCGNHLERNENCSVGLLALTLECGVSLIGTRNLQIDFNTTFDVHGTVHRYCIPLSITNKMQRYTIFFIASTAIKNIV
jgi:hypothetical protein